MAKTPKKKRKSVFRPLTAVHPELIDHVSEVARQEMARTFADAEADLVSLGFSTSVSVARNRDNTVDAELLIPEIPRRWQGVKDLCLAIEGALTIIRDPIVWIRVGFLVPPRPREVITGNAVHLGRTRIYEVETYWQRMGGRPRQVDKSYDEEIPSNNVAENFITARMILDSLKDRRRKLPRQMYVRLHWNPKNAKPEGR